MQAEVKGRGKIWDSAGYLECYREKMLHSVISSTARNLVFGFSGKSKYKIPQFAAQIIGMTITTHCVIPNGVRNLYDR